MAIVNNHYSPYTGSDVDKAVSAVESIQDINTVKTITVSGGLLYVSDTQVAYYTDIDSAIASGGYVTSQVASQIAYDVASGTIVPGGILSNSEIETQVGDYLLTYTSSGGLMISGGDTHLQVSSGAILAEVGHVSAIVDAGAIELSVYNSAGISLGGGVIGEVYINAPDGVYLSGGYVVTDEYVKSQGFLRELEPVIDVNNSQAIFPVLSGGTRYIYDTPLTLVDIGDIPAGCRAELDFEAGSGATLALPSGGGIKLIGLSSLDSGSHYLIAVDDERVVVNSYTVIGE